MRLSLILSLTAEMRRIAYSDVFKGTLFCFDTYFLVYSSGTFSQQILNVYISSWIYKATF